MKRLWLFFTILLAAVGMYADQLTAVLHLCNGSACEILISESSEIKIQGRLLEVKSPVSTESGVLFFVDDVASLSFEDDLTGVSSQMSELLEYRLEPDALYISGVKAGGDVAVYDLSGMLLQRLSVSGSSCRVPLDSFSKGMILVKVNGQTIKLMKP